MSAENNDLKRNYKDKLFTYLFGNPERKEYALALYNAINDTDHKDSGRLVFNTINPVVYKTMYNDVSFIFDDEINIYEHQSTYNPNIPLKILLYAAALYKGYLSRNRMSVHHRKKLKIPILKAVMFYNGLTALPDKRKIRLSELFNDDKRNGLELEVTLININFGHNRELMEKCKPLYEYSWFIHEIRRFLAAGKPLNEAIENVIIKMPKDFMIRSLLLKERSEVAGMFGFEFDEREDFVYLQEMWRKDGVEEGFEKGRQEATKEHRKILYDKYIAEGKSEAEADRLCDEIFADHKAQDKEAAKVNVLSDIGFDEREDFVYLQEMWRKDGVEEGRQEATEEHRKKLYDRYVAEGKSEAEADRLCDEIFADHKTPDKDTAELTGLSVVSFGERQDLEFVRETWKKEGVEEGRQETIEKHRRKLYDKLISEGKSEAEAKRICDEFLAD